MLNQSIILLQAYSYNGEALLAEDKCGEACRGLQEGVKSKWMPRINRLTVMWNIV